MTKRLKFQCFTVILHVYMTPNAIEVEFWNDSIHHMPNETSQPLRHHTLAHIYHAGQSSNYSTNDKLE